MSDAEVIKEADWIATASLTLVAFKIVNKQKLTSEDTASAGKAIGWVALRYPEALNQLVKAANETKTAEFNKFITQVRSSTKKSDLDMSSFPQTVAAAAGKRIRGKRIRGGVGVAAGGVATLLGLIAIVVGNAGYSASLSGGNIEELRRKGEAELQSSCPISIDLPPPPAPFIDFGGVHAQKLRIYAADKERCERARQAVNRNLGEAQAAHATTYTEVPARMAALVTAGVSIYSGMPIPAAAAQAAGVATAVSVLMKMFRGGAVPTQEELTGLVTSTATAFPEPTATASSPGQASTIASFPDQTSTAASGPNQLYAGGKRSTRSRRSVRGKKTSRRRTVRR